MNRNKTLMQNPIARALTGVATLLVWIILAVSSVSTVNAQTTGASPGARPPGSTTPPPKDKDKPTTPPKEKKSDSTTTQPPQHPNTDGGCQPNCYSVDKSSDTKHNDKKDKDKDK